MYGKQEVTVMDFKVKRRTALCSICLPCCFPKNWTDEEEVAAMVPVVGLLRAGVRPWPR